jgi:hypothetical protein
MLAKPIGSGRVARQFETVALVDETNAEPVEYRIIIFEIDPYITIWETVINNPCPRRRGRR